MVLPFSGCAFSPPRLFMTLAQYVKPSQFHFGVEETQCVYYT